MTNNTDNEDTNAMSLLVHRGMALRELGHYQAAREALRKALAVRSRPVELRHKALMERGRVYLAEGKKAMARKDFHRVLSENADYPGLVPSLAALDD